MSKITEILTGWKNLIWENKEVEELAKKRLEICVECPKRSDYPGDMKFTSYCTACGCTLQSKMRSPNSHCPDKNWKKK